MKRIDFTKFDSLISVADYFDSEDKCKRTLAESRWGDDVICPKCGKHHCKMSETGRYHCTECNHNFSCTVGTIFENTKISLRKWFFAIYMITSNKKGVSSCQLSRDIKVSQKTAWNKKHLQEYIDEEVYRWNTRLMSESARFKFVFSKSLTSI